AFGDANEASSPAATTGIRQTRIGMSRSRFMITSLFDGKTYFFDFVDASLSIFSTACCTRSAGKAYVDVRSARAMLRPTARPCRSSTGPPQCLGEMQPSCVMTSGRLVLRALTPPLDLFQAAN